MPVEPLQILRRGVLRIHEPHATNKNFQLGAGNSSPVSSQISCPHDKDKQPASTAQASNGFHPEGFIIWKKRQRTNKNAPLAQGTAARFDLD